MCTFIELAMAGSSIGHRLFISERVSPEVGMSELDVLSSVLRVHLY
jgi:hypothetical protein